MKCLNAKKRVTRFVTTYINFLATFQIECLHYIQKYFPEPTEIQLDDDGIFAKIVRLKWQQSHVYITEFGGISYGIIRNPNTQVGGGINCTNAIGAKEMLKEIREMIKS